MMFISILIGIIGVMIFGSIITYFQDKSYVLKVKPFTIKEKIKVPVVGTVILYDFDRDFTRKVKRDDTLSTAFMLVLMDNDAKGNPYIGLELNSDDGGLDVVFDRDSLQPSDRIKLMSVATNVNFEELQLLNKDMTRNNRPNAVRNAFTLEVMAKVQSHVDRLIDEAIGLYVERCIEFQETMTDEEE